MQTANNRIFPNNGKMQITKIITPINVGNKAPFVSVDPSAASVIF